MNKTGNGLVRRTVHPNVRVMDAAKGIVAYTASNQTIDSYQEVIRADGWRFNRLAKNAPFVDSHKYGTVENLLGKILEAKIEGNELVNVVQWAIDVQENRLAQLGWKMTVAGYLRAVSVGFFPVSWVDPWSDKTGMAQQLAELGLPEDAAVRTIYTEQEQVELSVCIIGANPDAVARAGAAGVIERADVDFLLATGGSDGAGPERPSGGPSTQRRALLTALTALAGLKSS